MARRNSRNMNGEQFLANTKTREVHDLDNEQTNCMVDGVVKDGYDKPYRRLEDAKSDRYNTCKYCIGR